MRIRSFFIIAFLGSNAQAYPPEPLWTRIINSPGTDYVRGAAADGAGGIYVTGTTRGPLAGPNPQFICNAYVLRYDAAGNRVWGHQIRVPGMPVNSWAACLGPDGGVYTGGSTRASLGAANMGETDAWVGRYSAAGELLWVRQLGSDYWDSISALASDGTGGVFFTGETFRALGGPLIGSRDIFVGHYTVEGELQWTIQIGTPQEDYPKSMCPDGAGGFFIGGSTLGNFGAMNAGIWDAWLARYDRDGNQLWIRQFGTFTSDSIGSLAPDGAGGVYLSGGSNGSLGGSAMGSGDVLVGRYDGDGNQLWLRQIGTSSSEYGMTVVSMGALGCYIAGGTSGNLSGANPNPGFKDAFLVRYSGSGELLWILQWGSAGREEAWVAAPDAAGGVFVAGEWAENTTTTTTDAFIYRFPGPCYANCDQSSLPPILNIADFACFLQKFAVADPYANCDSSTIPPLLNILDFACFLQKFAAGCP